MNVRTCTYSELQLLSEVLTQFVENRDEGDSEEETYRLNPRLREAEQMLDEVEAHRLQRLGLGFPALINEMGVAEGDTRTEEPVDSVTLEAPRG